MNTRERSIMLPAQERPRVYLAGPEVFLPDPHAMAREKQSICAQAGFEGVFPLDAALDLAGLERGEQARRIALANESLMRSCAALIANLTPFRGVSMDAGTAFEVGFMRALGRPVLGYTNMTGDYKQRAQAFRGSIADLSCYADAEEIAIEDFGLAENLMIEVAIGESGGRVVRQASPAHLVITELAGFRACVEQLRLMAA